MQDVKPIKFNIHWYTILIFVFCSIFGLVGILCGSIISNGTCDRKNIVPKDFEVNWMSKLDDEKLLCETIIPGSHDSGTYGMPWVAECQYLDINEQLNAGVRYFDVRVNKTADKYVIYHGPINGNEFLPILNSFENFLRNNVTETLILDFQHFDNGAQDFVYEQITLKLKPFAIVNNTDESDLKFVSNLKIKDCRGKCLIFFGYGSHCDENYIFKRNNDSCSQKECSLDSCYDTDRNSQDSMTYITNSIPYYLNRIQSKIDEEGYKGIFVLQCQLTDPYLILGPYSKEKLHDTNMSNYINNLKNNQNTFKNVNVIMRDFIDAIRSQEIYYLNFI